VQGGLIRVIVPRLGEARTTVAGFLLSIAGLVGVAFATEGWMALAVIPVVACGAIVTPALTGLMANGTPDDAQGELQGAMTSMQSLSMIIGPLIMSRMFEGFTGADAPFVFAGAPFLLASALTIVALFLALSAKRHDPGTHELPSQETVPEGAVKAE
jgi:DHA1 family tetracycline resistance protein-like MFS transporter